MTLRFFYLMEDDILIQINLIFNKLLALVLIGAGAFVIWLDGDGTFLIFSLLIGVPLFFAKENCTTIEVIEVEEKYQEIYDARTETSEAAKRAV